MKRILALIFLCLLYALPAQGAAPTIGTVSSNSAVAALSHNNNGNVLLYFYHVRNSGVPQHTAVAYAGVAMTKLCEISNGSSATTAAWYLLSPASGTNNLTFTGGGASNNSNVAVSLIDADPTIPFSNMAGCTTATGSSQNATLTVPSASGQLVIAGLTKRNTTEAVTVAGSETEKWNLTASGTADDRHKATGSTKPGESNTVMSHTWTTTNRAWAMVGIAILPASAVIPTTGATRRRNQ